MGLSRPAIAEAGRGRKRLGREAERCALALEGRQPRRVARLLGQNEGSQRGHWSLFVLILEATGVGA